MGAPEAGELNGQPLTKTEQAEELTLTQSPRQPLRAPLVHSSSYGHCHLMPLNPNNTLVGGGSLAFYGYSSEGWSDQTRLH